MPQSASRPCPADVERQLLQAFGRRLAHARVARGLSQTATSDRLGIPAELLSRYERGLHTPKLATLLRLRSVLAVSLDHLLAGAPPAETLDPLLADALRGFNALPPELREVLAWLIGGLVRDLPRHLGRTGAPATAGAK